MLNNYPFISILIPCRNEEKFIKECLDSVLANNYPKDNLEIFVIDGESTDNTKQIVETIALQEPHIKLLINRARITPTALNLGMKQSSGDIIMRLDAHASYSPDYIGKCVRYLTEYNADNVGGVIKTVARTQTPIAQSIAKVLSHPFGIGNSRFRSGAVNPQESDTVPFGCYKRAVFTKIGLFNESLARSHDMEFNLRLKKAGGKIMLIPEIVANYYAPSTVTHFIKHTISDGIWATYPIKFTKQFFALRHYIPLIFVLSLIASGVLAIYLPLFRLLFLFIAIIYLAFNIIASAHIAYKKQNLLYFALMPCMFLTFHLCYGLGSYAGLLKITYESIAKKS